MLTLTPEESGLLFKKLEYRFRLSNNPLVEKLKSGQESQLDELEILLLSKKLEHRFKSSSNPILEKLGIKTVTA
jgi:hypothetical protein